MNNSCSKCLFANCCDAKLVCGNYAPYDDENNEAEDMIESGRREFREEWFNYLEQWER